MRADGSEAMSGLQFTLLLHSVPHLGEKSMTRVLRLCKQRRLGPEAFLGLPPKEWKETFELRPQSVTALEKQQTMLREKSAELARTVRTYGVQVRTIESGDYPERLERNDEEPPPVLYAVGNLNRLETLTRKSNAAFTFALAFSNDAELPSLQAQDAIATELAKAGGIVVTGHDRQPYKRAALASQRRDRPIVYVFDRGLREVLGPEFDRPPFAAARIRDAEFDRETDLALSPFRLDDHGIGANNKRRDQLVFALADVIIAVDVRAGGGMFTECRRAQEQGRPVYVLNGGRDGNDALRTLGCPVLPSVPDRAARIAHQLRL